MHLAINRLVCVCVCTTVYIIRRRGICESQAKLSQEGEKKGPRLPLVGRSSNSKSLEMLHEHLQGNIICEDSSATSSRRAIHSAAHMRSRRVEFRQQETCLRTVLVTDNVSRDGEAVGQKILCVGFGILEHLFEVFVSFLILIACFAPLGHRLTMEYENVEEGVEQQHNIGSDGDRVEQHRLRCSFKAIRHECRLNHDQRVVDIFSVEHVAVECSLVGRVVEHLQELRSTKVEHELRVNAEVFAQTE